MKQYTGSVIPNTNELLITGMYFNITILQSRRFSTLILVHPYDNDRNMKKKKKKNQGSLW